MTTSKWNIDGAHSSVQFSIRHMVIAKVRGRFAKFQGAIDLDEQTMTKSALDVTIDAASIDTGVEQRDTHLRSADFFDAEKFPTLRYRSKSVEQLGADHYRVVGELTIRDATREVPLDVEFGGRAKDPYGNERVGFTARATIDRKDFGLKWNQALEAGGVLVGEKVEIELDVQCVKAVA